MVMDDIRARNESADQRRVFAHVSVFKPMNGPGRKLGGEDSSDNLCKPGDDGFHKFPLVKCERFQWAARSLRPGPWYPSPPSFRSWLQVRFAWFICNSPCLTGVN